MACKTIVEQLSEALGKENVNVTDTLPIVENNTLYRVRVGNLATSLGLTGAITGLNGGSATPVIVGSAPNYQVRGIVGGKGARASVNGDDSITIDTQLNNAGNTSDGAPLIPNSAASTILLRRLKAGKGISLTTESNRIIVENTEVAVSNRTEIISSLSDFPAPVSGVITLQDDTDYLIVDNISTSNRFVMGRNTVVRAVDARIVALGYTGTGVMFTQPNGSQVIKEITINCPNGTFVDQSSAPEGSFLMRWVRFSNLKDFGTLEKKLIGLYDILIDSHTGNGMAYSSGLIDRRLAMENWTIVQTTLPTLDFVDLNDSVFESFSIINIAFLSTIAGQTFLKGEAGGANVKSDSIAFVQKVNTNANMVTLDTIQPCDAGWDFRSNTGVKDTQPFGLSFLSSAQTTTITATDTPVVFNGNSAVTSQLSCLFAMNNNGRATYQGRRDVQAEVTASLTARPVSGISTFTFYIAVDGVVQTGSGISREISSGAVGTVNLTWAVELSTGDFVEVYVENNTSTNNCEFQKLVLRVKA